MRPTLTIDDQLRIKMFLESAGPRGSRSPVVRRLQEALAGARIVDPTLVPQDCVTMNSHVRLLYHGTGQTRVLRLAWPRASAAAGSDDLPETVSILSPVGAALLGSRAGDVITWSAPAGDLQGTVLEVLYQPEAFGDPG
ncbi:MAG: GreA/GreB family elongation factor [FCB group bacterium]|jgi:regulator of nucleoside diphosphate kinase|nr:GreA/GreB family elongation factor [FCB group bacterium]